MNKLCPLCHLTKPRDDFNKHAGRKDGLQSACRICQKQRDRNYYTSHHAAARTQRVAYRKARIEEGHQLLRDHLASHPCVDCGNSDIRVLDFDHVRGKKRREVTRLINGGCTSSVLQQEVDKCDVRCKNCHAIKTIERIDKCWRVQSS